MTRKKAMLISLGCTTAILATGYVLYRQNDYQMQVACAKERLQVTTVDFVQFVNQSSENFNIVFGGNSIAAGYSMKDSVLPLWERNSELQKEISEEQVHFYQIARPQENDTSKFLENLWTDKTIASYYNQIYTDYTSIKNGNKSDLTSEQLQKYYQIEDSTKISDLIMNQNTILVYCNGTGEFLNNFLKAQKDYTGIQAIHAIPDFITSLDEEVRKVDALFQYIFINAPKTQIYFVGFPDYFNLQATDFIINHKYQALASKYPNVTYVDSCPAALLYYSQPNSFYGVQKNKVIDVHPNQSEYEILLSNIYSSINENYIKNEIVTNLYLKLKEENQKVEFSMPSYIYDPNYFVPLLEEWIESYEQIYQSEDLIEALNEFKKIYELKLGNDFYLTPKLEILQMLDNSIASHSKKLP